MKINETTGLYENYGLWQVPFWQKDSFKVACTVAGVVLCLVLIFLCVRVYKNYKKRKKLSAWDQALFDLEALNKNQKVHVVHGKEFYLAVSDILKKYLTARFKYDVLAMTDAEVVEYLKVHHGDPVIVGEIETVLHGGVIIKFANVQAAQEQINQDYERVVEIIKSTIEIRK